MFLINLHAEIVACILSFRKSRHKPNLENASKYGFSPDLGEKNGGVLSMRMQVILDSPFARPGLAPIWGGKKGEFRDWTKPTQGNSEIVFSHLFPVGHVNLFPYTGNALFLQRTHNPSFLSFHS